MDDSQIAFLQMWALTVQPMCSWIAENKQGKSEDVFRLEMADFFQEAIQSAESHEPGHESHDFLVEFVTTATHYANLLYQYGVFNDD